MDFVAADMTDANRLTIHIIAAVAESVERTISENTRTALAATKVKQFKLSTDPQLVAPQRYVVSNCPPGNRTSFNLSRKGTPTDP